jgi:hypothetical protein
VTRPTDIELPESLPPIDAVEVVDLCGIGIGPRDFVTRAADAPSTKIRGRKARRVAALWRALPPGNQARCHIPPFGLRFYAKGRILAQASICWRCNNLHGEAGGRDLFYEFDASANVSRELLSLLEYAVGHPASK